MLRITGGTLRGRRFPGPQGSATRPTAEKVREAIASALASRGLVEGARVLDLFAGTGALGFEALSRGAREAVLVDIDRRADKALRASASALGLEARVGVRRLDLAGRPEAVASALRTFGPFDLVFADPPYEAIETVAPLLLALAAEGLLAEGAVAVVEHATRRPPALPPQLAIVSDYRYGDTAVALLALAAPVERRLGPTTNDGPESLE
jgi:16S rRNA (guanine966-N2)-methyltransferase